MIVKGNRSLLASTAQGVGLLVLILCFCGCKENKPSSTVPLFVNYIPTRTIETRDSTSVLAVIEIPAGTAQEQSIDTSGVLSDPDVRPYDFLPYPGNYGFISGSGLNDTIAGVLRPLPTLVMMQALAPESVIEVRPVSVLLLKKGEMPFPVIISVPADTTLQSIKVHGFVDFLTDYDAARHILEQWFLNYRGRDVFGLIGWRDENYARQLIADWKLKQ